MAVDLRVISGLAAGLLARRVIGMELSAGLPAIRIK